MKKHLTGVALLMALGAAQAAIPVLSVTASNPGYVGDLAVLHDGVFPPELTVWVDPSTVNQFSTDTTFTFDLGDAYTLSGLDVSVDNNDSYRFSVSLDGSAWTTLGTVLASDGNSTFGMDTMSNNPSSPEFVANLGLSTPIDARYVRAQALDGDGLYSIGEVQVSGTLVGSVPEPETYTLILAGLGCLTWVGRRHRG